MKGIIMKVTTELVNEHDIKYYTEDEIKGMLDNFLDTANDSFKIGGLEFFPSDILKGCDETAYHQFFLDYVDAEYCPLDDDDYYYICQYDYNKLKEMENGA